MSRRLFRVGGMNETSAEMINPTTTRLDRARGVLLGQLIGAHLGGTPGESGMALELARSLVRSGGYDPSEVHDAYVRWADSEPSGIGGATGAALREGQLLSDSQADGALLRVSPIAVAYSGDPEEAGHMALLDAAMTHPHPRCLSINQLFASVLAATVAQGWGPERTYAEFLRNCDPELRGLVEAAAQAPPELDGWVDTTFHNALFELLNGGGFEESLIRTLDRGADAAVVGALLGGVHGASAIPQRWIDAVPETGDVRALAEQLSGIGG